MLNLNKFLLILSVVLCFIYYANAETYYMKSGEQIHYNPVKLKLSEKGGVQIYCYDGRPKNIVNFFQAVSLQLHLDTDNYIQYDGHSPEEVQNEYHARRSSWSPNIFTWKQKHFKLDPFNQSCIGIESEELYTVHLHVIRIDYWKVLLLVFGVLIFLSGPNLSSNTLFYYLCGISLGVCASFLILIYIISKLFPKKPMMYGFMISGWTVGIYVLQLLWENLRVIFTNYSNYILYYMIFTGCVSFILCYRMGPPTNPRTKNLIKWTLQCVGLIMVFSCSHYQEASMGLVIMLLIGYNFPKAWVVKSKSYWKQKFPPKVILLTNDEYYHEGVKETNKALSELRKYCSSPECNQWETVLKLHNAKRFASFVEGNSHLNDEEVLDYENDSVNYAELTDDEEITEDSSNDEL